MPRNLTLRGRNWWFRMRVPKRWAPVEPRREVVLSLKTGDLGKAEVLAAKMESELTALWEARTAGTGDVASYQKLVTLAQTMGFSYRSTEDLGVSELVARLEAVTDATSADALLGTVAAPILRVSELPNLYDEATAYQRTKKNAEQQRIWRVPFNRAASNFIEVVGDLDLRSIGRAEAIRYQTDLKARVKTGAITSNTANRMLGSLSSMVRAAAEERQIPVDDPFRGLRLSEKGGKKKRLPIPEECLQGLVKPGALSILNDQARDIFLACVNTGARPSEICGLLPDHINLSANVPFIQLTEDGRELKNAPSERRIPLLGVSLEAMRRHPDGFPRYRGKHSSLSAYLNKYLRKGGLIPPECSAYGLRHSFQDRITAAGVPERTSADLMGHGTKRERYGEGTSLEHMARVLAPISY